MPGLSGGAGPDSIRQQNCAELSRPSYVVWSENRMVNGQAEGIRRSRIMLCAYRLRRVVGDDRFAVADDDALSGERL